MAGTPTFLRRELGLWDAVLLGLGSIIGTGVFVSLGLAAGIAGPAVLLALGIGAVVAALNGLSSAQLASAHAYSGGTYEYGHEYLGPAWGFTAGWVFLLAKSASAATAALGFTGYLLTAVGFGGRTALILGALVTVGLLTALVAGGIRRSSRANAALVVLVLLSLVVFVVAGLPRAAEGAPVHLTLDLPDLGSAPLLHASALMFVAYTGYARIATLGEEVREPRRTIPKAILATLAVTLVLYLAVGLVAVASVGAPALGLATAERAAPLEAAARTFGVAGVPQLVILGAAVAMLGVLLNLILGLSRVLLAMGRRGEMPRPLARLDPTGRTPLAAVLVTGVLVAGLATLGDVRTTWSFSAFSVLVYYAITNLAALRLPARDRLYPRGLAAAGLVGCLGLAFWVDVQIWLAGLGLIGVGLLWHGGARWLRARAGHGP